MSSALSTITFSKDELNSKTIHQETVKQASKLYNKNGFLVLKDIIDASLIKEMHLSYLKENNVHFSDVSSADALDVGHKRKMITVEIKSPFNTVDLYANPFILPIVKNLLGEKIILGSLGSVAAMPGSEAQHVHFDHPNLFSDDELGEAIKELPAFAITVIVPLVDITEENGPTRMWPTTHLKPRGNKQQLLDEGEYFDPMASIGDCILFDYRLLHGGMENRSNQVRPILYVVYYRSWFRDVFNYEKQNPLHITTQEYGMVPQQYQYLFKWAMAERTKELNITDVNSEVSRNSLCHCGSGLKFKRCHGKLM